MKAFHAKGAFEIASTTTAEYSFWTVTLEEIQMSSTEMLTFVYHRKKELIYLFLGCCSFALFSCKPKNPSVISE